MIFNYVILLYLIKYLELIKSSSDNLNIIEEFNLRTIEYSDNRRGSLLKLIKNGLLNNIVGVSESYFSLFKINSKDTAYTLKSVNSFKINDHSAILAYFNF